MTEIKLWLKSLKMLERIRITLVLRLLIFDLKRTELTPEVQSNVFDRMRTEREREANLLRAEGQEISQKVKATADREKIEIIAEAEKQSNILKGEGEAARNKILNDAFAKDPEFFEFIRSMEAYADTFKDGSTTMVISPDSDFLNISKTQRDPTNK